jgi:lipopolysaccharide exporter
VSAFGTIFLDVAIDNFVIAHYLGEYEVGRYAFAVKISSLALSTVPINLVTPIVVNLAIRRFSEHDRSEVLGRIFTLFNKLIFFGIMPAAVGVFVLSDNIILHVFDSKYASVDPVVKVVILFSIVKFHIYAFQTLVKPLELLHLNIYRYICSLINLGLNFWLVPRMGIMGAAIATGGTSVLNYVVIFFLIKRHVRLKQDWRAILRMSLNLVAMTATIYLMNNWLSGLVGLISTIAAGAAVYLAASYVNRPFTASERQLLNGAFGRKIWVF